METLGQTLVKNTAIDVLGRTTTQQQQFWTGSAWSIAFQVQRSYNFASQITSQTYPSGHTVSYEFDEAARTKKFTGNLGDGTQRTYAEQFQYSEWGTVEQESFGTTTPLYHKRHYNRRGQLYDIRLSSVPWATDQWNWNRGAILNWYDSSSGYQYQNPSSGTDNNGNVLRSESYIPDNDQISSYSFVRQNYVYDSLNRLSSVTELQNASTQTFVQANIYDRYGNRTVDQSLTTANVPKANFTGDTATNRLVAPGGYNYSYDAAGNQTNDDYTGGGQRTFDGENRMNSAQGFGTWQYYKYSGDGLRMRRIVNGFEVWQVYGIDGELLAEYPQNATPTQPQREYGYRNGELLITATPGLNIALGKPATQIDDHAPTTGAAKAVDGDTNGALWENYASGTNYHLNSWWQVDLQSVQNINSITVWGRTDCCWETAQNFYVFVSDNPFTSTDLNTTLAQPGVSSYYYGPYANPGVIAVNRTGRYVRVQLAGSQYLVMGEVQVWGGSTGQVNWVVPDHLGTPRMIADQTGALANMKRHDYLPFGEEIGLIGGRTGLKGFMNDGTRQKFTGYERDWETGLDYAKARYDASAQGRFLSVDPMLASADVASPQSLNRYTYVENNPLNLTDPSGLMPYDASHSFADVSDHFWGGGMDFSRPHPSRGQIIIAAAMYVQDRSIAANINEMRLADISRKARPRSGFSLPVPPNPFSQFSAARGNSKPEITVDNIELLDTWNVDSKVIGKGYRDAGVGYGGDDDYAIDVNRDHIDPARSTLTIAVTFSMSGDADWDKDYLGVTANPNGRWMLVDTLTGIPAIRKAFPDNTTAKVWFNVKAREMSKINARLKILRWSELSKPLQTRWEDRHKYSSCDTKHSSTTYYGRK